MKEFDGHGLRFSYPEDWSLADESDGGRVAVTAQSDGTAFWTVAAFSGDVTPEEAVESAVAAYREDYPDLDAYPPETTAGPFGPVVSREIEFVFLELIAAAHVSAFRTAGRTVTVVFQGTDSEIEARRPVLDAMTASVRFGPPGPSRPPAGLPPG